MSHPAGTMPGMHHHQTFNPWGVPRPCWHCHHFAALVYQGTAALCMSGSGPRVRSGPAHGCSGWEREPGADDEPGPPSHGTAAPGRHVSIGRAPGAVQAQPVRWAP